MWDVLLVVYPASTTTGTGHSIHLPQHLQISLFAVCNINDWHDLHHSIEIIALFVSSKLCIFKTMLLPGCLSQIVTPWGASVSILSHGSCCPLIKHYVSPICTSVLFVTLSDLTKLDLLSLGYVICSPARLLIQNQHIILPNSFADIQAKTLPLKQLLYRHTQLT